MLTRPNYLDWLRNVKIVLKVEKKVYVIDTPLPELVEDATEEQALAFQKHRDDNDVTISVMLASMTPELQKLYEHMDAHTIMYRMKEFFDEQARTERAGLSKQLFRTTMTEGSSAVAYALKMNGYIERLGSLGFGMDHELSIDLILTGLSKSYS